MGITEGDRHDSTEEVTVLPAREAISLLSSAAERSEPGVEEESEKPEETSEEAESKGSAPPRT